MIIVAITAVNALIINKAEPIRTLFPISNHLKFVVGPGIRKLFALDYL